MEQRIVFRSFMFEHKVRIVLSVIINIICLSLFGVDQQSEHILNAVIVLVTLYAIFIIVNILSIKSIQPI